MMLSLPDYVNEAASLLENAGYEAYCVGGCVRDAMLGCVPDDYDICTNAEPEETERCFVGHTVIETGMKHGTVTVLVGGHGIEITTYRIDGSYSDGRHPDSVRFSRSLSEDLRRRDFTVNAMAYSKKSGIVDLFGGEDDLRNKVIRCVGDPYARFSEDPLRILRAVRFASKLGFSVEEKTAEAMIALKHKLSSVSAERIASELKKAVVGEHFEAVLLRYHPVFTEILPELAPCVGFDQNNPHHDFDLLTHLAKTVTNCPSDPILRLAALLHDIGKPLTERKDEKGVSHFISHAHVGFEAVSVTVRRLKLSTAESDRIKALVRYHDGVIGENEPCVRRRLNQLGEGGLRDLIALQRADDAAQLSIGPTRTAHYDKLQLILDGIIEKSECFSLRDLAVNGGDIMALGFTGSEIGKTLKKLLFKVIDGELPNEKNALTEYAESLKKEEQ